MEQANAVADPRAWVHPLLAVLLLVLHVTQPGLPVAPTVIAAVLLFPPSLAASALSGRALDSLNPRAVFAVMRGFGPCGGIVYQRRFELGFAARHSPERRDETGRQERAKRRQQLLDHLYESLRAKDAPRAIDAASQWLREADSYQFAQDTQAILAAGRQWNEPRQFTLLMARLIPLLQPSA